MTDLRHELRPRSPVEIYDAALHLCVHTKSELPVLAVLGSSSAAATGLVLLREAQRGHSVLVATFAFCGALVFRLVCQGAATLAAAQEIEGHPPSAWEALRQAGRRLPSFVSATALSALTEIVLFAMTAGLSALLFPVQFLGPALIAEGSAHGWSFGRTARQRLGGRLAATVTLRLLHGLMVVIVYLNLHSSVLVGLGAVRLLTGADVSFLEKFASPDHAFYDLALFAVACVLLEPVRCATMVLALADARVRHEGFDLVAALKRLNEALPAARAGAAVLLAFMLVGGVARANDADDDCNRESEVPGSQALPTVDEAVQQLPGLVRDVGLGHDAQAQAGLEQVKRLSKDERVLLPGLVVRIRDDLDSDCPDDAKRELRTALTLMLAARGVKVADAHEVAAQVLASDDFDDDVRHPKATKEPQPAEDSSWWARFWKWVFDKLDHYFKEHHDLPDAPSGDFRVDATVAESVTAVLIALALGVTLSALWQRRQRERSAAASAGGSGAVEAEEPQLDALAKPVQVWSADADRLAAEGRFREAMRALYLALLGSLHRHGAIDYHPALSNWDYCADFRGDTAQLPPFRELTRRFDYGWYGRRGADASGYAAFKELVAPLLGHGPAPASAEASSA